MQFVLGLKELWRKRWWVAPGLVLALIPALVAGFHVGKGVPPKLTSRQHTTWAASSQVLIDAPNSAVGDLNQGFAALIPRAGVYANLMTSQALVEQIGKAAKIPGDEISVAGPIGTNGQRPHYRPTAIAPSPIGYSLQLDTDITQPTIRISATAPTSASAMALATGAATGLTSYVSALQDADKVPDSRRVDVRSLGPATVNESTLGTTPLLAIPVYLIAFGAWCLLILFVTRFAAAWRGETPPPQYLLPDWPTPSDLDRRVTIPAGDQRGARGHPELDPALADEPRSRDQSEADADEEPDADEEAGVDDEPQPSADERTDASLVTRSTATPQPPPPRTNGHHTNGYTHARMPARSLGAVGRTREWLKSKARLA
jgi:hypothetical protein